MRLRLITGTPLNVSQGSGTFVGIRTLADALEHLGVTVRRSVPHVRLPVFTAQRLIFNASLRPETGFDAEIGFDMDGYRLAGRGGIPHIAALKGVIADELRFQKGLTRATMAVQARCEALHARRADMVVTTSRYAAARVRELYGVEAAVIPELIDLARWRTELASHPASPDPARFTVLCVCRLYRRKRVDVLLRAAARLRERIPALAVRIVGDGPERDEFRSVWRELRLEQTVEWLGNATQPALAEEYNRCDVFCLPSVQEGFGIVFLEAMAAGKPIVAARAAAVPEVVTHGVLADPDDPVSLAECLAAVYADPARRAAIAEAGLRRVAEFDAPTVARLFLETIASVRKPSNQAGRTQTGKPLPL